MNVLQAISKLIKVSEERIPVLMKDGPEDRKLCLDGDLVGLKQAMPNIRGGLLRVGRHLWKVTWVEENGNLIEKNCEPLTQSGT